MDFSHVDTNNEMIKKIIKSSYEVFALNDYKKASTNMIVKKAGVSRGILYHYFKDKEELFDFLNFYSIERSIYDINKKLKWDDDDVIRRICDITKYKLEIVKEYPYMIDFSEKYSHQMFKFVDKKYLEQWREKIYNHGIDYSKFKDESSLGEVLHIVRWTYKGLGIELLKNQDSPSDESSILRLMDECDKYYKILVSNFYR